MTDPIQPVPSPSAQYQAPRNTEPLVRDWTPEQGHIKGAGYEWSYAARQPLTTQRPTWQDQSLYRLPQMSQTTGTPSPYRPPAPPNSFSLESVVGKEGTDFWTQGAGAVLMGAKEGDPNPTGKVDLGLPWGGSIPVATLPLTMVNAPTYFREGLLSVVTGAMGGTFDQNEDGSQSSHTGVGILDSAIDGALGLAKSANDGFNSVLDANRVANATTRITQVADLYRTEQVVPTMVDQVTSFFAGGVGAPGAGKWNLADVVGAAEARGWDPDQAVADLYDIPIETLRTIQEDPDKYASPLSGIAMLGALAGPGTAAWDLAAGPDGKGIAYSVNPLTNMAVEMGQGVAIVGASMLAGGAVGAAAKGVGFLGGAASA